MQCSGIIAEISETCMKYGPIKNVIAYRRSLSLADVSIAAHTNPLGYSGKLNWSIHYEVYSTP